MGGFAEKIWNWEFGVSSLGVGYFVPMVETMDPVDPIEQLELFEQ